VKSTEVRYAPQESTIRVAIKIADKAKAAIKREDEADRVSACAGLLFQQRTHEGEDRELTRHLQNVIDSRRMIRRLRPRSMQVRSATGAA